MARTRVSAAPMPLAELTLAARVLQDRSRPALLDSWRRRVRLGLTAPQRALLSLIPPVGWSPTFLSPARTGPLEELMEHVRATPRRKIQADLAAVAEHQPVPTWTRHLADDERLRRQMYDALECLYGTLLRPYWEHLAVQFADDRALRTRLLTAGGIEGVFTHANPRWMRWNPPVLEVRMKNRTDYDLRLQGQGVLLVPSVWWTRTIVDNDTQPQPIVSYPVGGDRLSRLTSLAPVSGRPGSTGAVTKLLGRTRAAVLGAIADHPGCTTRQLAVLAHVAESGASEHAAVLREAGLISTLRHRNTAHHSPTPLGLALLNNRPVAREWARDGI
ncbi:winged helix-turn-helix domain-containing protein [Streptomyces sp. NBC_01198]|uniref:winged helix-turn-helix domain-containing protein n=1 Tax=Streptomyces sp. NBC_01198 TaxID=2903769 RepID=UPI002E102FF6|nr:helix-turn-helix domain-containing protein [Streptomyces sp. NBC_01198]